MKYVIDYAKRAHKQLQQPVHNHASWSLIFAAAASSFILITSAFAQTGELLVSSSQFQPGISKQPEPQGAPGGYQYKPSEITGYNPCPPQRQPSGRFENEKRPDYAGRPDQGNRYEQPKPAPHPVPQNPGSTNQPRTQPGTPLRSQQESSVIPSPVSSPSTPPPAPAPTTAPVQPSPQPNPSLPPTSSSAPIQQKQPERVAPAPVQPIPNGGKQPMPDCPPGQGGPGQGYPPPGQGRGYRGDEQRDMQKIDQQRFEMMKRGLNQFVREIERIKKQVQSIQKQKDLGIPADLKEALAKLDQLAAKIKAAKTADELEVDMSEAGEAMRTVHEGIQKLYRLSELNRFFKMAEREMAKVNKEYQGFVKKVNASKLDLNEALENLRKALDQQSEVLAKSKETAKNDPEAAADELHHSFFGGMDNVRQKANVINITLNLRRGLPMIAKELQESEKVIKNLEKKKVDTAELRELLARSKQQYSKIKELSVQKPLPIEEIIDAIEEFGKIREEAGDTFQRVTGDTGFAKPDLRGNGGYGFHAPQGFDFGFGGGYGRGDQGYRPGGEGGSGF